MSRILVQNNGRIELTNLKPKAKDALKTTTFDDEDDTDSPLPDSPIPDSPPPMPDVHMQNGDSVH